MPRVIPRQLKAFEGVGWNQQAVVQLTGGPSYHEVILKTSLAATDMTKITVELNGDPIYTLKGTDLLMLERYRKRTVVAGFFPIYFSDMVNSTIDSLLSMVGTSVTG